MNDAIKWLNEDIAPEVENSLKLLGFSEILVLKQRWEMTGDGRVSE